MARSDKVAAVAALTEQFRGSSAVLLTEYRGLTVKQLKKLRRGLGEDASYAVVKNTLATLAAKEVGLDFLESDLNGPTAIAFVTGEPVEAAKTLRDFAKENPALVLKSGAMDGAPLSADAVRKLADLESREVLLAKAAGVLKAKISQAAYAFTALPSKTVRTIDALRDKQEQAA
ncbi:MAG: 50S ribosomal protein L10 [Actinomyces sp.]|jgi:large subunit ribosomal protein L10|uniref:Large ribosomal subunit protein uL10 n=1 Tax=Schaalia naturae TaxID=635203 RepID=A0ABW2SNF8_9ACTO|nr:50S ribosomal protein L10 [Actinomyces sp.]MCI1641510.1 50S ribosomal protein L10 [Actinomyces sp.]MCI1661746.1 50S ribosomal protein L10 [Actinomyces sp.]MCI1690494.1 50S ribosomal protein L10 [Actinomyces sp.]MCI1786475.1 50S ribosomal protein L10 [Actinomyces sp.]MCI1830004.1 50S ribosomal protein L10 [Actinomyces sp.]